MYYNYKVVYSDVPMGRMSLQLFSPHICSESFYPAADEEDSLMLVSYVFI